MVLQVAAGNIGQLTDFGRIRPTLTRWCAKQANNVDTDIRVGANLRLPRAGAQPQIPAKVEVEEMSEQANVAAPATAGDIMRTPLTTVEQNDHVAAAAYLMKHAGATAVTVLDPRTSQPVGIVTEADIAHAVADGKDVNSTRIYELMTTRPTVISTTTSVRDAARVMTSGHFRHLPVVGDAGLVGIVDITDVCRVLLDPYDSPPPAGPAPSG
jgi:CBS domain-containing protein